MARVVVENITKRYGEVTALADVSLEVEGQVCGILGINGAGKSTLFKLMSGVISPDSGRIYIGGYDLRMNAYEAKRSIGYLPEDFYAYERLTGAEFLEFVADLREVPHSAAAIEDWLKYFGMYAPRNSLIKGYSFGMVKRIGLIAAMLGDPDVLILDEPLGALDIQNVYRLAKRLQEWRRRGKTIFLSSHVFNFVERLAASLCIIHGGRILAQGTTEQLAKMANQPGASLEESFFRLTGLEQETVR